MESEAWRLPPLINIHHTVSIKFGATYTWLGCVPLPLKFNKPLSRGLKQNLLLLAVHCEGVHATSNGETH